MSALQLGHLSTDLGGRGSLPDLSLTRAVQADSAQPVKQLTRHGHQGSKSINMSAVQGVGTVPQPWSEHIRFTCRNYYSATDQVLNGMSVEQCGVAHRWSNRAC